MATAKDSSGPPVGSIEDLDILKTVGTGTFGRVVLVKQKETENYFALKVLEIAKVIKMRQTAHVKNEKSVLQKIDHPFIVNMVWASHTEKILYMLLEYVAGGELFYYLRSAGSFNQQTTLFYTAEIVSAIEYLHKLKIIYRDLKPENLLLTTTGHLKITDFGFAKEVQDSTYTLCGTPEYLAPEIIQGKGHNKAVDWWALGILIYEMLAGYPPFYDEDPIKIYTKIVAANISWPRNFSSASKEVIKRLLEVDRTRRIGSMRGGSEDVKKQTFFKSIKWDDVAKLKLKPPIVPNISHAGDTSCFDEYPEDDWQSVPGVSPEDYKPFADF